MTEDQEYLPDKLIKDAAKHGELVVFVGAGASMLCGSPDWRGFSNQVVLALENEKVLSFLEAEQLRGLGDPRRTLSIAMALARENNIDLDFDSLLHPKNPNAVGSVLYELLSELRPVFVTTNYDKWLDDAGPVELSLEPENSDESGPASGLLKRPKYYLREHLSSALLAERGAVIHLHGSYTDLNSMVISLKDYIEHYADPRVQEFLSAMFKNHTVLFVGYGLAELEILDYIIRFNDSLRVDPSKRQPRHFLLYACRSTESVQTSFIERFFHEQCGVQVLKYCIDNVGYQEIIEVFKAWRLELDVRDPSNLDNQIRLDSYIASPSPEKRNSALVMIDRHPELASYFINSLSDETWFKELENKGFFNIKNAPLVKEIKTESGVSYQADGWPALRYLEKIAASIQSDIPDRIIEIVRTISADSLEQKIDNWRTWWSLATILAQLPLRVITESDINMVSDWLKCRFESSMIGHELGEKLLPRLLDSPDQEDWKKALLLVDALTMRQPH